MQFTGGGVALRPLAHGSEEELNRSCVSCGLITGRFCDGDEYGRTGVPCLAANWMPNEEWVEGQRTPLCSFCDNTVGQCRFCLRNAGPTPAPHSSKADKDKEVAAAKVEAAKVAATANPSVWWLRQVAMQDSRSDKQCTVA